MAKKKGYIAQNCSIGEIVRQSETEYIRGSTQISKYVNFSMHDTIETIEAYLNSKHISGEYDSLDREKPFFNIVVAARNIWYRSTVIDRKKIRTRATKSQDTIDSFLANVILQEWMRKENFDSFLSMWGLSLAGYGSSPVKFVENSEGLHPSVTPWNRVICDPVQYTPNPKIEVLEYTESQLRKNKSFDQEVVASLCDGAKKARETLDKQRKDNRTNFIKLYEVHGEFPLSYITQNEADEDKFVQQMHVLSFLEAKEHTADNPKYDDYVVYAGREAKEPNMITHLLPEDGRTLAIGSVEYLFQSQWMMNHSIKAEKDQLDLASKIIFQTADTSFLGQNALTAIETGDILIHADQKPLTQVNNTAHDLTNIQSFASQWKSIANEIVGISESMLGNTAPSGTAWRQVETLLRQNQSLFREMRRNKITHLIEMFRTYILPYIKKQMDTSEEVSSLLEANDVDRIDARYIKNESVRRSNNKIKKILLSGGKVTKDQQNEMLMKEESGLRDALSAQGNQRFFKPSEIDDKTWTEQFKDFEWELEIDSDETDANDDAVATLTTVFQTLADPMKRAVLQTPEGKLILNKILTLTNAMSPLELPPTISAPTPQPVASNDGSIPANAGAAKPAVPAPAAGTGA